MKISLMFQYMYTCMTSDDLTATTIFFQPLYFVNIHLLYLTSDFFPPRAKKIRHRKTDVICHKLDSDTCKQNLKNLKNVSEKKTSQALKSEKIKNF